MIKIITFLLALLSAFILDAQKDYEFINSGDNIIQGNNLVTKGEYGEAIKFFEKVNQSDTNYHIAQFNKIIALFNSNKHVELEKTALKSLQNENDYSSKIYYWYIESLITSKKYGKAKATISEALKLFPLCFENKHQLAIILIEERKLNEAVTLLNKIINIHPQHSKSHYVLAKIKADQGFITEAILGFGMAIISNRSSPVLRDSYIAMEDLMNNNYEILKKYKGENCLKNLDNMIQSKIALQANYESRLGLDNLVDRQTDLLMRQFSFDPKTNSFGMNYYGKFLNEVINNGFQEAYILDILGVVNSQKTDKKKKKYVVELKQFKKFLKNYWHKHQNQFKYEINGVTYDGEYNYNHEGQLFGIGEVKNDFNVGSWIFLYNNGTVKSQLNYNEKGELNGDCSWFDLYGNKSQSAMYINGKNEGFARFSRANNCNWYSGNFVNNKLIGEFKLFRPNGVLLTVKTLKENKKNGPLKEYSKSGVVVVESSYKNDELDGYYKEFYVNGSLLSESYNIEGEADGVFKEYHLNGKIKTEGGFSLGSKIGQWKTFYYNGSLKSEYEFNKKGELVGWNISYASNGDTVSKTSYINGFSNRVEFSYGSENRLLWEHYYKKGKLKKYNSYDSSSVIISSGNQEYILHDSYGFKYISARLKNGEFDGLHSTYWKNGNLKRTKIYEQGVLNGEVESFFESGELDERFFMNEGNYHGRFESFHISGEKYAQGYYYNGLKIGEWKFYNPNGTLSQVEFFLDGALDGILVEYDNAGLKEYETKYHGGVVVRTDVFNKEGILLKRYSTPSGNGDYSLVSTLGNMRLKGSLKGGNQHGKLIYYYPNGRIEEVRIRVNGVNHGEKLVYHTNGKLLSKGNFDHGYEEGNFVSFHYNGNKYWEATYEHGLIRDSSVYYYESGEKEKSYYYDFNGNEIKLDLYHKNGQLASTEHFENGLLCGTTTRFNESGMLMISRKYNGGELYAYSYMKNNSLLPYISVKRNDKLEPKYNNGNKSEEHNIKEGLYHGFYARYFPNGNIWIEANYRKGEVQGKYSEYYINGRLKTQGDYKFGELNGLYVEFYKNGKVKNETAYLYGSKNGEKKEFSKEGKLISTITYKDNVVVDIK